MAVSPARPRAKRSDEPLDGLRRARTCYDHLAGRLGVTVTDAMARRCLHLRWVHHAAEERTLALTRQGRRGLRTWFGINWRR